MKRIVAIDTLRGFALLGILLMNIMYFAMPQLAYFNLTPYYSTEWYDRLTFTIVEVIANQKFMALFSILFGASVMLITSKMEEKDNPSLRYHYVRNFWLLLIGLAHSTFIWSGDVLALYAVSAFFLYPIRKLAARWHFILGLVIFLSAAPIYWLAGEILPFLDDDAIAELVEFWEPSEAEKQALIEQYRGPYQLANTYENPQDISDGVGIYYLTLLYNFFTRALGMMMMGMALFTWGILTASKSDIFYRRLVFIGLGIGLGLSVIGVILHEQYNWHALYSPFFGRIPNHVATPFTAFGYIGLIMLWSRTDLWRRLQDGLSDVGRMALTNYIVQSVIGTFIFYGWGLGLFGSVNRATQLLFVLGIWIFQIFFSVWWMARFRYGPLEWLWRSLSLWQIQSIRRETTD